MTSKYYTPVKRDFTDEHLPASKFLTYSGGSVYINKKAFRRLVLEGAAKWYAPEKPKTAPDKE